MLSIKLIFVLHIIMTNYLNEQMVICTYRYVTCILKQLRYIEWPVLYQYRKILISIIDNYN